MKKIIIIAFLLQCVSAHAQLSGTIGSWNFDEGSGNVLHDQSGNGHDGAIQGASWAGGQSGSSLHFNGVSDYVVLGNIGMNYSAFTMSLWFKTDTGFSANRAAGTFLSDSYSYWGSPSTGWVYWIYLNQLAFDVNHNDYYSMVNYPYTDNTWTHVVFTKDASNQITEYVNGVEMLDYTVQMPWADPYFPNGEEIRIGMRVDEGWYFQGSIDELNIFNRSISANEVAMLYNGSGNNSVPEPSTFLLVAAGLAGAAVFRRKVRK